jgi:fluoroquinolone transport system permease protein
MKRMLASLRWNIVVQFRNGFYYVSAFFVLVFAALLHQVQGGVSLALLIPAFMLLNLMVTNYYFIASLVLLEKQEGMLAGLVVTPLRDTEYLVAKIVSLTLLSMLESLLIIAISYGFAFNPVPLLIGMILLCALYTLFGFVVIARFDSINEYLIPAGLLVVLILLPLIDYLGLWHSILFYLHPVQPMLVLMHAAFAPLAWWELLYGALGSLCWLGLCFYWARRTFARFVVRPVGQ